MLETILDTFGDYQTLALLGLVVGLIFGAAAQHSRFCLRAATAEVAANDTGPALGIWLVVFATALLATQGAVLAGMLDTAQTRQISGLGSISGAVIGGSLFGIGMVLSRGCASRLLILAGTGNMRALVSGLVLTLVAQASLTGVLAPLREWLFQLWTVPGGVQRDLMLRFGIDRVAVMAFGTVLLFAGLYLLAAERMRPSRVIAAIFVGLAVTLGWVGTYALSQISFEPVAVSSVTFTGPSTDTLMTLINERGVLPTFSIGLVPGVFAGSALMALATGGFRIQRFDASTGMERYMIGAVLMGFGSMLAGGCAVGAGVSGGAVLSLTAWLAVFAMWVSALAATRVINARVAVAA